MVDLDAEIAKCDKKLQFAKLNLDKIVKLESQKDYEQNVPEDSRLATAEKVCKYELVVSCCLPLDLA